MIKETGKRIFHAAALGVAVLLTACGDPDVGFREGSPRDALPPYITELTELGVALRPHWSADGSRFLYMDALVGNVYEFDVAAGTSRPMTAHFEHNGFTRVNYLANGDILLCGPDDVDPNDPEQGRWRTDFWLLDASLNKPAVALGEPCFEGPAVARKAMRIAWTRTDYPDRILRARSQLWVGDLDVSNDRPRIINQRRVASRGDFYGLAMLEPQDFRPPHEDELIFTAYAYRGGEVMGVDLNSGELQNYSQNWGYEEAEGIAPDGRYVLVERERTMRLSPRGRIDLWLLRLDGSGDFTRLTHFSEYRGYGANNPVISPDCRWMLFALRKEGGEHGNSDGLFLYDLAESPHTPADFCGGG